MSYATDHDSGSDYAVARRRARSRNLGFFCDLCRKPEPNGIDVYGHGTYYCEKCARDAIRSAAAYYTSAALSRMRSRIEEARG